MARDFKGKNNFKSAKSLWVTRLDYLANAYPEGNGRGGIQVKDLDFFEQTYYGMIDTRDQSIIPNEDFIVPIDVTSSRAAASAPRAMDFVVNAFNDLKNLFERACRAQILSKRNSLFAPLQATRAYTPPKKDYEKFLKRVLTRFNSEIIPKMYDIKKIITFDDYVKTFINYLSNNPNDHVITLSKWCRSSLSGVLHSGLAIDIAGLSFGDDQPKISSIIDDEMFPFYKNAVLNGGFAMMRNNPGILIADLQSPAMTPYLSNNLGITDLTSLFNTKYINTVYIERNILSLLLYRYYNFFVITNPMSKELTVCNGITTQSYTMRPQMPLQQMIETYKEDYWMDVQIELKNIEDKTGFSRGKINHIKKKAKNLLKTVDSQRASGYIIKEFGNQTWNKPYGYGDYLKDKRSQGREAPQPSSQPTGPGGSSGGGGSSY
tara:strand:- start:5288 stop:6586 length:1299 start_codon:yes stop_codon:yes gene_type:complete